MKFEFDTIGNYEVEITEFKGGIYLDKIIVQDKHKGIGTSLMNEITEYADKKQYIVLVTPSIIYGASSTRRLKAFYKRFGFVKRKGYYELPFGSMIRIPK